MLFTLNLPEQFRQVLSHAPVARSRHFSLHHAPLLPAASTRVDPLSKGPRGLSDGGEGAPVRGDASQATMLSSPQRAATELSSVGGPPVSKSVDNPVDEPVEKPAEHPRAAQSYATPAFGFVIPKRMARRAVTRNLIRRQMRCSFTEHRLALNTGAWVLRLRAPFDLKTYPSAASEPLRRAVREELHRLMGSLPR